MHASNLFVCVCVCVCVCLFQTAFRLVCARVWRLSQHYASMPCMHMSTRTYKCICIRTHACTYTRQVLGGSLISDTMGGDAKVVYENLRDVRSARAPPCPPPRFPAAWPRLSPCPIPALPAISSSICFLAVRRLRMSFTLTWSLYLHGTHLAGRGPVREIDCYVDTQTGEGPCRGAFSPLPSPPPSTPHPLVTIRIATRVGSKERKVSRKEGMCEPLGG